MLEKNKDYVEFTLQCTTVERTRDKDYRQVCFNGYSDFDFPGVPMDVVCKEFDHKVVVVGKREFERLQARADSMAELAKQWEENYNLLFKKIGFDTLEELVFYLTNVVQCDTLQDAIASLQDKLQYTCDEWKDMKKKLEECEKDYIFERDKAEALQTENEQLRNERTHIVYLNDPLGVIAKWEKVTGYDRPEDFLKWKANIEGIIEAWKDGTGCKYPGDARRLLEKWQTMTRSETPENAEKWIERFEETDKRCDELVKEIREWKEGTGCPSPSEAKSIIEAGMSWHHAYNEIKEVNKKLADSIKAWQNVTGNATPEDYLAAMIKNTAKTVLSWEEITGFSTPEKCSSYIDTLEKKLEDIKDLIEEV